MTKFILYGGSSENSEEGLKKLFAEVFTSNSEENEQVLICTFARELDKWEETFNKYSKRIIKFKDSSNLSIKLARLDSFIEDIKASKYIFFTGGSEPLIKAVLRDIDLKALIKNKIVIGASAGANIFSEKYYSNDRQVVEEGLGILNIKTICHFESSKIERLNQLIKTDPNLPCFAIPEDNFIIIFK